MNILLLSAYFPPEVGSAAHLFADIGAELATRGHSVSVITSYPTYNVTIRDLPEKYSKGFRLRESYRGMEVLRVKSLRMPRHVPILRGVDQISTAFLFLLSGFFLRKRFDVILVYSPPLFLGLTAWFMSTLQKSQVVLNVQDLFPQSAVDLGLLKSRVLIKVFEWVERFLYNRVDEVTVHSAGNREHVIRHGGKPGSTCIVPNVVDVDHLRPGSRNGVFRENNNIPSSSFVVSFAGVLGYSQDLDTVIEAARLLDSRANLVFYIVGDGVEKKRLEAKAKGMKNVRFLAMLQKNEYAELLHASDACLVTLRKIVQTPVVPSKILSIMAAGKPVIAGLPLAGDAPKLIEEARCGICVEPENAAALVEAVLGLMSDNELALAFGNNGRAYAETHLSIKSCVALYESIFRKLLDKETK
jgi:glycosyltransferase involved in cell wall biosynthesis